MYDSRAAGRVAEKRAIAIRGFAVRTALSRPGKGKPEKETG